MTLSADLEAAFGANGFSLDAAFDDLGSLLTGVGLPQLDLRVDISLDVQGLGTDQIGAVVDGLGGNLSTIGAALPDIDQLLGPLQLAFRVPELIAGFDLDQLIAELQAEVAPGGPGLTALVASTTRIGSVPAVQSVTGLLGALGLDLSAPGALLGRTAHGVVSLAELIGGLLAVEAASRRIEERAALASDLLSAERLAGLITSLRATGGARLADLLVGIDPDDPGLVELIVGPLQAYAGLAAELGGLLVRGLAFAEATVAEADFPALVAALTVGGASLALASPAAARDLVASAAPLVDQVRGIEVPAGGDEVILAAVADLRGQLETVVDGLDPAILAGFVQPAIAPVLDAVRAVRAVLDQISAVIGVVFVPIEQALAAVDLTAVGAAIGTVVQPVADAVQTIEDAVGDAQTAIETAVGAVHDALTPVRTSLTDAAGTVMTPFTEVHRVIADLNLAELQQQIQQTLDTVTTAINAAPVQPVFDVSTGIVETAADALELVPRALLPDDLKQELEAACAPVQSLDLEPARAELHTQLGALIDSINTDALDAVAAGYAQIQTFVGSIDPHPHVADLETTAFSELTTALDAIDPTEILAPVLAVLDEARAAIAEIDLRALLRPVDEALDQVGDVITSIDPATLLAPVTGALDQARTAVREALHLDELTDLLGQVDGAVAAALARVPIGPVLDALDHAWPDLLAELRGTDDVPSGSAVRGPLAGLLPGVPVEGLPEVIAWIRGERNGSEVVRGRLLRAATTLTDAQTAVGGLGVIELAGELARTHRALAGALGALPADSLAVRTLSAPIRSTDPGPDLGRVLLNADATRSSFSAAVAVVQPATAPDRSEVQLAAGGVAAAFAPLSPLADKARELAVFVGVDPAELVGSGGVGAVIASLAARLGPEVVLGVLRSVATRLTNRISALVHDGLVVPLTGVLGELSGLLDALSVDAVLADVLAIRDRLGVLVDGLRPSTVLAAPLAAFDGLQHTLATFDPLAPVRLVVDGLRTEIAAFAHDVAPSTLLAPLLTLYDDLAGLIAAFDVAGLLEPVLNALAEIGRVIDHGMDGLIDALARLKAACASDGGPIPGLDLSVAASVDVGGLGLG
ncbi:MAG TPA: hypothetical protein VIT41_18995 [Microlunatus sp.]